MRVLLIEDEQMVRDVVRKMLQRRGHNVTEAQNGRLALDQLKSGTFDLVITDMVMPEMNGIDTLATVRQLYPGLRVIAMSGGGRTANTDLLSTARKLGASAILQKPFTLGALSTAIEAALA